MQLEKKAEEEVQVFTWNRKLLNSGQLLQGNLWTPDKIDQATAQLIQQTQEKIPKLEVFFGQSHLMDFTVQSCDTATTAPRGEIGLVSLPVTLALTYSLGINYLCKVQQRC
jgi:hypothetical protein